MLKIALTGSIATGKSYVLSYFQEALIPIFSFDKEVSQLLNNDLNVFDQIKLEFPEAIENNLINRKKLADIVFFNKNKLNRLENIIYPKLFIEYEKFLKINMEKHVPLIIAEVPLLFEKKLEKLFDQIILVTCSKRVQMERALQREGMTKEKLDAIISNQMPDIKKRKFADYIIFTDIRSDKLKLQIDNLIKTLKQ
jgi:dephospho-CoA kinase